MMSKMMSVVNAVCQFYLDDVSQLLQSARVEEDSRFCQQHTHTHPPHTHTHTHTHSHPHTHTQTNTHKQTHTHMDGLRNHGPLGLDMLKAPPPPRQKLTCARTTTRHLHT